MTMDDLNIVIADDSKSITISEVTEDSGGDYICQATTPLGQTRSTGTLRVNPPRK